MKPFIVIRTPAHAGMYLMKMNCLWVKPVRFLIFLNHALKWKNTKYTRPLLSCSILILRCLSKRSNCCIKTYLFVHKNRGKKALCSDKSVLERLGNWLVHDCWESYFKFDNVGHSICGAHLVRELESLVENHQLLPHIQWCRDICPNRRLHVNCQNLIQPIFHLARYAEMSHNDKPSLHNVQTLLVTKISPLTTFKLSPSTKLQMLCYRS